MHTNLLSSRNALWLALAIPALATTSNASNWPTWRGPSTNGSANIDAQLPTRLDPEQAKWSQELPGKGGSTPIVWDGVAYLTTPSDGQDAVVAFDLDSGAKLWTTKLGESSQPKHRTLGSSCNASPVTDGNAVFVYFRSGRFAALELDGAVRWSQDLSKEFGPENLYWDQGSSPVAVDDAIILTRLHDGPSWIAAFDKSNGSRKWLEPRNYETPPENNNGYTTPIVYSEQDSAAALVWCSDHLSAHDLSSGSQLWDLGGFNPSDKGFWPAISSPVLVDDILLVPAGRDDRARQASIHGIRLNSASDAKPERIWTRNDVGVFVPSLAADDARVYLLRNRGGVVCLDPKTGKTIWENAFPEHRSAYYASPVIANGTLYAAREDGALFVAQVGGAFNLISENEIGDRIIASPVPTDKGILIRTDNSLFLF